MKGNEFLATRPVYLCILAPTYNSSVKHPANVFSLTHSLLVTGGHPAEVVVKNLPDSAGDLRDEGSTPGLGRDPGGLRSIGSQRVGCDCVTNTFTFI